MNPLLTRKEAAKLLKISVETIDRYRKNGKLPYRQIGKRIIFTDNDLNALLNVCAVSATAIPTDREKLEMKREKRGQL